MSINCFMNIVKEDGDVIEMTICKQKQSETLCQGIMKMASRLIDLNTEKKNYMCNTLFLLISKKQICTCSTLFVFPLPLFCTTTTLFCTTKTSNFLVTHFFYGGIVVYAYPIFCFLCSSSLLFFTAAHFHLAGR